MTLNLLIIIAASQSFAREVSDLYIGARSRGMGGAYVALADDEQAIFLNPAGLAGVEDIRIHISSDVDLSQDILSTYTESADAFSNFSTTTINALMGQNIYGRAQIVPALLIPNFGLAILIDGQATILAKNEALPQIKLGIQNTNGIQAAAGFTLFGPRRRREGQGELRVGIGGKVMWRRGGLRELPPTDLISLGEQGADFISSLTGSYKMGIGVDLGTQYSFPLSRDVSLSFGSAFTDIGDTSFGSGVQAQEGNLSVGVAAKYHINPGHIVLTYDYRNILEPSFDWRKRNHLGLELALPFLSIYGGVYQSYLSFGAGFDLFFFRVNAISYASELGTLAGQDPNRRYMLRLDFKFNL